MFNARARRYKGDVAVDLVPEPKKETKRKRARKGERERVRVRVHPCVLWGLRDQARHAQFQADNNNENHPFPFPCTLPNPQRSVKLPSS